VAGWAQGQRTPPDRQRSGPSWLRTAAGRAARVAHT
jgi:hypothetical protein